jgi:hypothetical protein
MRPDQLERRLRERLDALGPARRAELLHVLMLPHFERANRMGEFWAYPQSRAFAELLTARRTEPSGRCSSGCCGRPSVGVVRSDRLLCHVALVMRRNARPCAIGPLGQ